MNKLFRGFVLIVTLTLTLNLSSCSYKSLDSGIYICEDNGSSIFIDSLTFQYLERLGDVQSKLCIGSIYYNKDSIVFTTDNNEGKLKFCKEIEIGYLKRNNTIVFRDKKYIYLKGSVTY